MGHCCLTILKAHVHPNRERSVSPCTERAASGRAVAATHVALDSHFCCLWAAGISGSAAPSKALPCTCGARPSLCCFLLSAAEHHAASGGGSAQQEHNWDSKSIGLNRCRSEDPKNKASVKEEQKHARVVCTGQPDSSLFQRRGITYA